MSGDSVALENGTPQRQGVEGPKEFSSGALSAPSTPTSTKPRLTTSMLSPDSSLALDAQLEVMKIIFQKELPRVSIDRYYQTFWVEETNSFLESWLVGDGKDKVEIGKWSFFDGTEDDSNVNPYDKETYDQVRTITYSYHRSTSVYSGLVSITMTQYCRRVQRSICVVASTLQFSGMPYANAFLVHIRWVASLQKRVSLRIQVGIDVVFSEQVLVASKIKANTMQEMTQAQLSLFRSMKNAVGLSDASFKDPGILKTAQNPVQKGIAVFFPFVNVAPTTQNDAQLKLKEARTKLARVRELPLKTLPGDLEEQRHFTMTEMDAVHEALDAVLLRKYTRRDLPTESPTDASAPAFVKVLSRVGHSLQSSWDGAMRSITPRRIQLKDPSLFVKKPEIVDKTETPKRDEILTRMELLVSSTITGVSLQEFAEIFLADERGQKGFFSDWLRQTGRKDIEISPWDGLESSFLDSFSWESFTWHRTVTATFDKAEFSHDQSPSLDSTQTQEQFYRIEDDARLVFGTTTKLGNIPFADAFDVHIRWVVTKLNTSELSVKVGLAVVFKKKGVLLEPKIRARATREGRRTQIDLLLKIRSSCGKVYSSRTIAQQEALIESMTPRPRLIDFISSHFKQCMPRALSDLLEADSTLHDEFENAELKLRSVELFLNESKRNEDLEGVKFILGEINVVNDALDNIVVWHGDSGGASNALVAASLL